MYNEEQHKGVAKEERERVRQLALTARDKMQETNERLKSVLEERERFEERLAEQLQRSRELESDRNKLRDKVKSLTDTMTRQSGDLQGLLERFRKKGSPRELLAARKRIATLEAQLDDVNSDLRVKRTQLAELRASIDSVPPSA